MLMLMLKVEVEVDVDVDVDVGIGRDQRFDYGWSSGLPLFYYRALRLVQHKVDDSCRRRHS